MHVLIFALTQSSAEVLQNALSEPEHRYTLATALPAVLSCLEEDRPNLVVIERAALTRLQPSTLLSLIEPGQWPSVILVDTPAGASESTEAASRLLHTSFPFYRIGELRIDTRKKRAGLGGRWANLPPLQYRLLLTLAKRAGEVVSYKELLRAVWGYEGEDSEARELLKVHIRQIRRRLGLDPKENPYIRSVRGFGYMLAPPEED